MAHTASELARLEQQLHALRHQAQAARRDWEAHLQAHAPEVQAGLDLFQAATPEERQALHASVAASLSPAQAADLAAFLDSPASRAPMVLPLSAPPSGDVPAARLLHARIGSRV